MLIWNWRAFNELNLNQLYEVLALRAEVFIIEQNCTESDLDFHDQDALHLLGYKNNKLIAYLRLFLPGTRYKDTISFGRVLVEKTMRGQRIAHEMMEQIFLFLKNENKVHYPIVISAQAHLEKFYQTYDFKTVGMPYDEAGIKHLKMKKEGER